MTIWENLHRRHAQGKINLDIRDQLDYMVARQTHPDDMEEDKPLWTIERPGVSNREDNSWGTQQEPTRNRTDQNTREPGEGTRVTGKKRPSTGQEEMPRPQRQKLDRKGTRRIQSPAKGGRNPHGPPIT